MFKIAAIVATVLLIPTVLVLIRAQRLVSKQVEVVPAGGTPLDADAAARRLARAIAIRTVSTRPGEVDDEAFRALRAYLEETFPAVHRSLKREEVGGHSLLYTWEGSDPEKRPVLLLAHTDVVPAAPESEDRWTHPPFTGVVADGFIWGRGAMDFKVGVLGTLEAVEGLLGEGFRPRRSVLLAFGHDEEVGGGQGAARIASLLRERGVEPEWILDEGLAVLAGIVPGVTAPVAAVGIAEKGYLTLELAAEGTGGHSSTPPRQTTVGRLSRALARLEDHPTPARLIGPARQMFAYLAPEMPFGYRVVFSNLWLFGPMVKRKLAASPGTNAVLRTTIAPTVLEGSLKENVLPTRARALVNVRLHPNDTLEGVLKHVRSVVDDPGVAVTVQSDFRADPIPPSPTDASGFRVLERTLRQVFSGAVVAPSLVVGTTDSRHYAGLSPNVYRFAPVTVTAADLKRFHGIDERLAVEHYGQAVLFYRQLLRNANEE